MPSRHKSPMSDAHFGWVRQRPDMNDRNRRFMAPRTLVGLPAKFTLRRELPAPFSPAWDQGRIGSCGPHAACRDLLWAMMVSEGRTDVKMPSRLFTYFATRSIMGTVGSDSGVDNRSLMQSFERFGWCDEELWPYDVSKFKKRPPQEAIDQAKARRIRGYLAVEQNLQDMKACIAMNDGFVFGFTVYESWEDPSTRATGRIPMPAQGEPTLGGHDVWMLGWDDERQVFVIRNSHSDGWGDHGYGTIPYSYATNRDMSGDFWTIQKSGLVTPAPGPLPTPTPIPTPAPAPTPGVRVPVTSAVKMSDGTVVQWDCMPTVLNRADDDKDELPAGVEDGSAGDDDALAADEQPLV